MGVASGHNHLLLGICFPRDRHPGSLRKDEQTIVALEQEKYVPSLALAFRIARVFSVPLDEVFEYEDGLGQR